MGLIAAQLRSLPALHWRFPVPRRAAEYCHRLFAALDLVAGRLIRDEWCRSSGRAWVVVANSPLCDAQRILLRDVGSPAPT